MKAVTSFIILTSSFGLTSSFQPSTIPITTSITSSTSSTSLYGYVPDGFTKESYAAFKAKEAEKNKRKKNLGGVGPKGFKSRSFQSFQEALERGEATHLMPVLNAKERYVCMYNNIVCCMCILLYWFDLLFFSFLLTLSIYLYYCYYYYRVRKGELKEEDIPYMQRGGAWDNSDVKGAKKVKWLKSDKDYASGGYKKEQSVSIFGKGAGLDWTGSRDKTGPSAFFNNSNNKKSTSVKKDDTPKKKKKNIFGF